jgi:hypothetical protein
MEGYAMKITESRNKREGKPRDRQYRRGRRRVVRTFDGLISDVVKRLVQQRMEAAMRRMSDAAAEAVLACRRFVAAMAAAAPKEEVKEEGK